MSEEEIIDLFNQARRSDYRTIENDLSVLSSKIDNIKKGGQGQNANGLNGLLDRIVKAYDESKRLDFFHCADGVALGGKIELVQNEVLGLATTTKKVALTPVFNQKLVADYRGRTWATRRAPFVDRMACAWLISRFIDPEAVFLFTGEDSVASLPPNTIVFDMYGGEFTHVGDLCTFEVLVRVFGLKDRTLRQMAEVVHDLDMKDEKYRAIESQGLESILSGIRRTEQDDHEALTKGMQVFEMLYQSKRS